MPSPVCPPPPYLAQQVVNGFLSGAASRAYAKFAQNHLERAEIGEGGLQQIESHESGKPKPINAVVVRQHKADQDEASRKPANDHFHKVVLLNYLKLLTMRAPATMP
jgi:hypothetical protein